MRKSKYFKLKNLRVLSIALVDKPAIDIDFLALKRDKVYLCEACKQLIIKETTECPYCGGKQIKLVKGGENMEEKKLEQQVENVSEVKKEEQVNAEPAVEVKVESSEPAKQEEVHVESQPVDNQADVEKAKPSFGALIDELDKIIEAAEGDLKKKLQTFKGKLVSWAEEKYPYPYPYPKPKESVEEVKAEEPRIEEPKVEEPKEAENIEKVKKEESSLKEILNEVGLQDLVQAVKELKEAYKAIQEQMNEVSKKVDESVKKSVETSQVLETIRKQAVEKAEEEKLSKLHPVDRLKEVLSKCVKQ